MDVVFGYGQVGQALVKELSGRGRKVRVVTRSALTIEGAEHRAGDARDPAFCRAACADAEVVYVCMNAPYDRWATDYPPLQAAVLEGAAAARAKLVVLENLYMYGPHDGPLTESLPMAATEAKGRTRAEMSEALLAAHREGQVRVAIGRASDFFGPGVTTSQLGERVFGPLVKGQPASMIGDPDTQHSFAYVPDVARALAILGERPEADGRVWHLPSVSTLTTRQMLRRAGAVAGTPGEVSRMPRALVALLSLVHPMVREIRAIAYQFDADFVVDSSAFESTFGMHATPLDEALAATIAWYRARRATPLTHRRFTGPSTSIRILESALDTGGARLRFEQTVELGGGTPPRHIHRHQTETFTVRSGRLMLEADGHTQELGPGESLAVPPGVAHTFWNSGEGPCVHEVTLEPAENMERFFEGIVTLEAQHRLPPHGRPDLLRIALLFGEHDNVVAGIPRPVQRLAYGLARAVAVLFGVRAPTWSDAPTPRAA